MNSLQIFNNNQKKLTYAQKLEISKKKKTVSPDDARLYSAMKTKNLMLYGISPEPENMSYGKSFVEGWGEFTDNLFGLNQSDDYKRDRVTDYFDKYATQERKNYLSVLINQSINEMNTQGLLYKDDVELNGTTKPNRNPDTGTTEISNGAGVTPGANALAWDPRLTRIDAFVSTAEHNATIVPFSSATAASAYYKQLFNIEKGVVEADKSNASGANVTTSGQTVQNSLTTTSNVASDKMAPNTTQVSQLRKYDDEYGTASLMNPYCVTTLVGGLRRSSSTTQGEFTSHLYDIRDTRRFYDTAGETGSSLVKDADDMYSINNPTTTNIITWSNRDKWGRTPYSFQDFCFCKYWKIIPNNRLITFRKYAVPTFDNLNFHGMMLTDTNDKNNTPTPDTSKVMAPIATVVTYFDGDSANKLSDLISFTTGTKWKEINSDIHKVSGDTGSNPRAVIDQMFENGGFAGSRSNIVNTFIGKTNGLTGQFFSFGKFLGLLDPNGYQGHSQAAWENMTRSNVDPQESIYSNRIIGPVNRIQSVKAREPGIEFSQSFTLTCEYVARPIGGLNTKAVMLDILANCLEIASPEATFWGGGYHFMIHPHMYPFKRDNLSGSVMDALYAGKIFGNKGAIANALQGIVDFGKKDDGSGNSAFDWSNVTKKLGDVLGQTMGAIGNLLQSVSSTIFGESSTLTGWLKSATDGLSSEEQQKAGLAKINGMLGNLNKMWKDKVIQETMMPSISGMKSILTGEPTGNWHMTVGNPLNPIMVVGNLICTKMDVKFEDELGPDDFPFKMKVTYSIEHAMARDKSTIQSMFNRGAGKIYRLPDYIAATSDYETKVDNYTGRIAESYDPPQWMSSAKLMSMTGAKGWQTYKISPAKKLSTLGNPDTTFIPKFSPIDSQEAYMTVRNEPGFLSNEYARSVFSGNIYTRKRSNN